MARSFKIITPQLVKCVLYLPYPSFKRAIDSFAFLDCWSAFPALAIAVTILYIGAREDTVTYALPSLSALNQSGLIYLRSTASLLSRYLSQLVKRVRAEKYSSGPEHFIPIVSEDRLKCSTCTVPSNQLLN